MTTKIKATKSVIPYFERLEDLRRTVMDLLGDGKGFTIQELFEKMPSFRIPSKRHLTAILMKDPKKRFKCTNKIWQCSK